VTRTTAILRVVVGVVIGAMAVSAVAFAQDLPTEPTAANDLAGFAEMQKKYEEAVDLGLFTKASGAVDAYYYSERIPVSVSFAGTEGARSVTTVMSDCRSTPGFPKYPKFLYGGLDPYSLVAKAASNRKSYWHIASPYANFFAAGSSDMGVCANFTVLPLTTGPGTTTQYVVVFKTAANKAKFVADRLTGKAPMPAAGFWCMWGVGNGSSPHLASPNNPQFAVYQLDAEQAEGLDSQVYIGANYWPRTHGMGSPAVLGNLTHWLDEVLEGDALGHDPAVMVPLRYKSHIFLHPLESWE